MPSRRHIDDDDEVKDGGQIYVPLHLCDSVQRGMIAKYGTFDHQPHHATLSDEERERRSGEYDAYKKRLSEAWRGPQNVTQPYVTGLPSDQELAEKIAAWFGLARPTLRSSAPPYTDPRTRVPLMTGGHGSAEELAELGRTVEKRRRAQHDEFCNALSDAWRGGK